MLILKYSLHRLGFYNVIECDERVSFVPSGNGSKSMSEKLTCLCFGVAALGMLSERAIKLWQRKRGGEET